MKGSAKERASFFIIQNYKEMNRMRKILSFLRNFRFAKTALNSAQEARANFKTRRTCSACSLMAVITLAGTLAVSPANTAYASSEASVDGVFSATLSLLSDTSQQVTLIRQGAETPGVSFKGDEAGATQHRLTYPISVVKDGGDGTVGYCITPFARGTSPNGEPQTLDSVPFSQLDELDKKLLGIMSKTSKSQHLLY